MIADYLARELVDPVFAVPAGLRRARRLLAAYGYAAQIYCDFSGYTDMAIGLALLMGFVFPQNFNSPYRATGFRDFWRRWHMTLSRFLRDYLYIPLGGNRKGRLRTYLQPDGDDVARRPLARRLLELRALGRASTAPGSRPSTRSNGRLGRIFPGWFRWFVVFNLVVFGWILFRSADLDLFGDYLSALVTGGEATLYSVPVVGAILLVIGMQLLPERPTEGLELRVGRLNPLLLGAALAVVDPARRRDRAEPGRPSIHLLPVLMVVQF